MNMTAPDILKMERDGYLYEPEPKECYVCGCVLDDSREDMYLAGGEYYCENCLLEKFRVW